MLVLVALTDIALTAITEAGAGADALAITQSFLNNRTVLVRQNPSRKNNRDQRRIQNQRLDFLKHGWILLKGYEKEYTGRMPGVLLCERRIGSLLEEVFDFHPRGDTLAILNLNPGAMFVQANREGVTKGFAMLFRRENKAGAIVVARENHRRASR